jgi:hypothetical protein
VGKQLGEEAREEGLVVVTDLEEVLVEEVVGGLQQLLSVTVALR